MNTPLRPIALAGLVLLTAGCPKSVQPVVGWTQTDWDTYVTQSTLTLGTHAVAASATQIFEGQDSLHEGGASNASKYGEIWAYHNPSHPNYKEIWLVPDVGAHAGYDVVSLRFEQPASAISWPAPFSESGTSPSTWMGDLTFFVATDWPSSYPSGWNNLPPNSTVDEFKVFNVYRGSSTAEVLRGRLLRIQATIQGKPHWIEHWVLNDDYEVPAISGNDHTEVELRRDSPGTPRTPTQFYNALKGTGALCETTTDCSTHQLFLDWVPYEPNP